MHLARLTCLALTIITGTAIAQPPPRSTLVDQPPAAEERDDRSITIMWAPLRALVGPLAEFTGEYRLANKVGVSVMLGAGTRTMSFENSMTEVKGTEVEFGVQGRYYVLGSFTHGAQIGAELQEEYVTFKEPLPAGVVGVAAGGLTAGAFVGYKVAARFGFTFEAQLGARYVVMEPQVTGMGDPMFSSEEKWMGLLHLNVGWTF